MDVSVVVWWLGRFRYDSAVISLPFSHAFCTGYFFLFLIQFYRLWNFVMTYKIDVKIDEARHENAAHHHNDTHYYNNDDFYSHNLDDDDDVVWQAVSVMVLPGMVWVMCCLKSLEASLSKNLRWGARPAAWRLSSHGQSFW